MAHPLRVSGSESENRWSQTKHEIFAPLPCKLLTVSPSGSGKSSILLAVANILFEHMTYWAIFSASHDIDPAWKALIARIKQRYKDQGIEDMPFLFSDLTELTKVLATQRQRIAALKEQEPPVTRLPMLACMIDDVSLEQTRHSAVLDNAFARSRHYGVNLLTGCQLYKNLSVAVRSNADILTIHRLPTQQYLAVEDSVVGQWVSRQQFRELCEVAWSKHEYGFLTIRLKSRNPRQMFAADFETWLEAR